ncbi:DUF1579 domain-containing protein [Paenibacillus sp. SC116]|uniref:DUF1579 domain-containing protein n=1 Tax=Paenibacillus sp. SC116 TaxID=2968986 RepID=UPI00215A92B7|nr:DUF1579 domain-containing protein [Paenibacillus sp. SC116]MCR8843463.1 DUF1579 domain-containing protein [Paenibacillus sp. SC116]
MTKHDNANDLSVPCKPESALMQLNVFVGKWNTEGIVKDAASGSTVTLKAMDTYEWLPGGYFLIHHVDGQMGDSEVKAIEMIGYDAASQMYITHSYDNQGNMNKYQAMLLDNNWTIAGQSERFSGRFSDDRMILTGEWKLLNESSNWEHWMDIKLTKIE